MTTVFDSSGAFGEGEEFVAETINALNSGTINLTVVGSNSAALIPINLVSVRRGQEDGTYAGEYGYILSHAPASEIEIFVNPWNLNRQANFFGSMSTGFQSKRYEDPMVSQISPI